MIVVAAPTHRHWGLTVFMILTGMNEPASLSIMKPKRIPEIKIENRSMLMLKILLLNAATWTAPNATVAPKALIDGLTNPPKNDLMSGEQSPLLGKTPRNQWPAAQMARLKAHRRHSQRCPVQSQSKQAGEKSDQGQRQRTQKPSRKKRAGTPA